MLRSTLLQEIQLIHSSPDCQENIGRRCCTRIDWILERSCQCWSGLTESQRVRIGDLATQCAAQGFSAQRGAERTLGVKIFVGVLTAGKNKVARQAIRDTWGSDARLHRCIVITYLYQCIVAPDWHFCIDASWQSSWSLHDTTHAHKHQCMLDTLFLYRVLFFSAKPTDERTFDALRKEAAAKGDIVVLPTIWESYYNITHQTLEVLRAAAQDVVATHVLKVHHIVAQAWTPAASDQLSRDNVVNKLMGISLQYDIQHACAPEIEGFGPN